MLSCCFGLVIQHTAPNASLIFVTTVSSPTSRHFTLNMQCIKQIQTSRILDLMAYGIVINVHEGLHHKRITSPTIVPNVRLTCVIAV